MTDQNPRVKTIPREEFSKLQTDFMAAIENAVQARFTGRNSTGFYDEAGRIVSRVEALYNQGVLGETGQLVLNDMRERYSSTYSKIISSQHSVPHGLDLSRSLAR